MYRKLILRKERHTKALSIPNFISSMKHLVRIILILIVQFGHSQTYTPTITSEGLEAGVFSDTKFLGETPCSEEINLIKAGRIFVIGENNLFEELGEKELKSSKPILVSPRESIPSQYSEISFSGLEAKPEQIESVNGFNNATAIDMMNVAINQFISSQSLFSNKEDSRLILEGTRDRWVDYSDYTSFKRSNSVAVAYFTWTLKDKRTRKVLYESSVAGGNYLGSAKNLSIQELQDNINYHAKMTAISSLRRLLQQPEFLEATVSKTEMAESTGSQLSILEQADFCNNLESCMKASVTIQAEEKFGSGFIISPEGYILTNEHVVADADIIDVKFSNGMIVEGKIIRSSAVVDVALIKVGIRGLPYFKVSDDSGIELGSTVKTIGTPESRDLGQSVTQGIVSGYRPDEVSMIQTDLSVNRGNSGGPLLTEKMEVIGIVTSKLFGVGTEGINFSITIGDALKALKID
jgi:S1-C subfamily serine protease